MNLSIRDYEQRDLEACRALWVELTQHHRDLYDDPTIGGDAPGLEFDAHLAREDLAAFWVAELDGAVVGMTGLLLYGRDADVEPVVVRARLRGGGVGRALIAHALAEARARGVRFLSLRPVARNVDAIRLFVDQGFSKVGQIELSMDLGGEPPYSWMGGVELHGHTLEY